MKKLKEMNHENLTNEEIKETVTSVLCVMGFMLIAYAVLWVAY